LAKYYNLSGFGFILARGKMSRMDFSRITDDLFIGTTPSVHDYSRLRELGVRLVINMRIEHRLKPDPNLPPLSILWLPTFDSPFIPIPIKFLLRGAQAALEAIRDGGKVYAHCAGGRHRGVAMGAVILIAQGMHPESAMGLIKERRSFADPRAFYIRPRILKFAKEWDAGRRG
jgi:protein tyrosine phosphatase (PTP) superfamily phosphohydrolase (DUF442 family)